MAASSVTADDVVAEAERVVQAHGLEALSVRRIGEALGVSRQVVYTHFGGMHGLLAELHRRTARALAERVVDLDEEPGTLAHVKASGRVYVAEARRRPRLFELAFGRPLPTYVPDDATLAVTRQAFDPIIACAAAWLAAQGPDHPSERAAVTLARALWSVSHGHITLELAGHAAPALTDALLDTALEALVTGWGPSAA